MESQDLTKSKKTKKGPIILFIIILFAVLGLPLIGILVVMKAFTSSETVDVGEYQSYLENKYGKDEGFSYTGKYGDGGCPIIDAGFCELVFVSERTNKEFVVRGDKYPQLHFTDQYNMQ